jgi:hypothetical protein
MIDVQMPVLYFDNDGREKEVINSERSASSPTSDALMNYVLFILISCSTDFNFL